MPSRDGAVPRLIAGLERVGRLETPVRVVPEVAAMFRAMAGRMPPADRFAYDDLAFSLESDPEFRERFLSQPGNAALVRDTVAINTLSGSAATNVIPAVATAQLDARLLPDESCEEFLELIERTLADPRLTVEPILASTTAARPPTRRSTGRSHGVLGTTDRRGAGGARVNAGFSDAHYFQLGLTAYGFVPRWLHPDGRAASTVGQRISVENLQRGVRDADPDPGRLDRASLGELRSPAWLAARRARRGLRLTLEGGGGERRRNKKRNQSRVDSRAGRAPRGPLAPRGGDEEERRGHSP